MRDIFVLNISDQKPFHKLQELKTLFTINRFMLQKFLAIKKDLQSSVWQQHPEFEFTEMKSNSIRKQVFGGDKVTVRQSGRKILFY